MTRLPFTLKQLEYFEAVARTGSIVTGAGLSHVSPSAVGSAIDELEAALEAQLFIRRKARGMELTPLGSHLLKQVRILLEQGAALTAAASENGVGISGAFSLGCYAPLVPFIVPAVIDHFHRTYPAVELEIVEDSSPALREQLLQGRIEGAILYGVDTVNDLEFAEVGKLRPYVLLPVGHPLAGGPEVRLADLTGERLLTVQAQPSLENTSSIFAAAGVAMGPHTTFSSSELVRCLVGRGLGYSVMLHRPAHDRTYDGNEVVACRIAEDVPSTPVGVAYPRGVRLTGRAQALIELLRTTSFYSLDGVRD